MSKSLGNVIAPEDMIKLYGTDTVRAYILFMAPPDKDLMWSNDGLEGIWRFTNRVWRLVHILLGSEDDLPQTKQKEQCNADFIEKENKNLLREMHRVIGKVTSDMERFGFNTAISALMELVNSAYGYLKVPSDMRNVSLCREVANAIVLLISPIEPHMAEELWHNVLGNDDSVNDATWPKFNSELAKQDEVEIVVQVNGKIKARMNIESDAQEDQVLADAKELISEHIDGKDIKKEIYIPNKLVNIVAK